MKPLSIKTLSRITLSAIAASALLMSQTTSAETYTADNLVIENVYTFATPPGALAAGGYLTITNTGQDDDTLIGGSASFSDVAEVHEMKMIDDVMKMRRLQDGLQIPAGETVELVPGGFHMMFIKLNQSLKDGEAAGATLQFSNAGEVPVEFQIIDRRKQPNGHAMKHDKKHGSMKHDPMKHNAMKHGSTDHGDMTKKE